ncbi:hypothetical protein K5I29_03585 [Flavobacterium agricola]|uniref:DKNYY family protein n=1 Tax=Flavobacterium agricola TaxID=2870839 RepID=A0ABY6M3E8_9FLAO|nr:hypothetical protein [Flavobacterium agricola]UYW02005.1 hypothetical protein K5I29_03585 [Flavobacterium agricola]
MKKIYFGIIILFCFTSCNDKNYLGNNFYYLSEYESMDIGYPYGTIIYKSSEKNMFEKIIINSDVVNINNDENYIIVKQSPNKKLLLESIKNDLNVWNNYYISIKKDSLIDLNNQKISIYNIHKLVTNRGTEVITDSIFNNEVLYRKMFRNKFNYYIIEKKTDSVYGPLTLEELNVFKKKKKIDLNFEN